MIEAVIMILLVTILLIAIIKWLGPMASIPGNILNIFIIIIVVLAIFKLMGALGFGFGF